MHSATDMIVTVATTIVQFLASFDYVESHTGRTNIGSTAEVLRFALVLLLLWLMMTVLRSKEHVVKGLACDTWPWAEKLLALVLKAGCVALFLHFAYAAEHALLALLN
jgi:hypothetical protein